MSRRQRAARAVEESGDTTTDNGQRRAEEKREAPATTAPSTGKGKSPLRLAAVMWGLPFVLFVVIAIVKQCGS